MTKFRIILPTFSPFLILQYDIFSSHALITLPFQHACFLYACLFCYSTVVCFTANVTLLLQLNDEFDGFGLLVKYGVDLSVVMAASVFMTIRIL